MNNECYVCGKSSERTYVEDGYKYVICIHCGELKDKWKLAYFY